MKLSFQDLVQKQFSEEIKESDINQSQMIKSDLLLKDKSKINWGERRASFVSGPNPDEIILITSPTVKFDIQMKNKTKWAWKKGCSLQLVPLEEQHQHLDYFKPFVFQIKFPVKGE